MIRTMDEPAGPSTAAASESTTPPAAAAAEAANSLDAGSVQPVGVIPASAAATAERCESSCERPCPKPFSSTRESTTETPQKRSSVSPLSRKTIRSPQILLLNSGQERGLSTCTALTHNVLPTRECAERKSRSRETALSKTDVMILRLLLAHNASSAPWSSPLSLQRSIAWQYSLNRAH